MTEIQKIKEKQKQIFYSEYYGMEKSSETFSTVEGDMPDTYCFSDVNYNDKTRSQWDALKHYKRIETMLRSNKNLLNDKEQTKLILGALRYWVQHDFINPNWWHNQIGMPMIMSNIALVMEDYLTDDLKNGLEKLICRGSFKMRYIHGMNEVSDLGETERISTADKWTGANLMWGAVTTIRHALWTEDEKLLKIAVERLSDEICYAPEGIQSDGAFCQHGPRWYSGGYGKAFVCEITPILYILHGTSFAFPKEKINIILKHVLDGQRAMQKNGCFDFGAVGREYVRPGSVNVGELTKAVKLLSLLEDIPRKNELERFYAELIGEEDNFEATKFYDSICQLCHKKNGVYIGVRGRTEGVYGAEKCNNEGVLSYNMSYGTVTCVMQNGKEYFDISPFWDYSKIPGTTAREETDEQLLSREGWEVVLETPCRAWGKAENNSGVLSEKVVHDGISLISSFFVFDGAMVVLGADIKDEMPHKGRVYTTVEQCRAFNPVIEENFVKNGGVTYKNLDAHTEFVAISEQKSGSWSRNEYAASAEILEDTLFTVTIPLAEHNAYAYLVFGDVEPQVSILRNDRDCQAIKIDSSRIMAVFHNDTSFSVDNKVICGNSGEIVILNAE